MPQLIPAPSIIEAAGTKPKRIEEYAGRVSTKHETISVARMVSPSGWQEPGQRPQFEEITVVLKGTLQVDHEGGVLLVSAGQGVICRPGEWVRYSTPGPEGAEYVAVCLPAFSPSTVHRDE
ncbi:MAG: cupin domain-containing protein [Steroidobacteraceae bacterium]